MTSTTFPPIPLQKRRSLPPRARQPSSIPSLPPPKLHSHPLFASTHQRDVGPPKASFATLRGHPAQGPTKQADHAPSDCCQCDACNLASNQLLPLHGHRFEHRTGGCTSATSIL